MAGLTVDCSHFLHLEAGRLPYAATGCQIDYIFCLCGMATDATTKK